ncbi:phosphoadenylyl-sulfate reductase [Aliifodinibius sp. S!AR15-10]|uniref:phosphoadenylyl-sulfate reductase n=1 Tax=Aliifodinibius sp. S!AR15-10 TaxID=2950437 RepID=UPI002860B8EC|nr:phosphoadenylyl-sulfate reductase [Aliifodinibius sp. S!AR15-10]MDR8394165.1 phosphoadenylyl-sulfate reductase [Aliifodinibius sp. S!AR15-10]
MVVDKTELNRTLSPKLVDARVAQVFNTFKEVLVTSSFGTTSAVLLHIISRVKPGYPVCFIDTGYHFEETLAYKKQLTELLDLNVISLRPDRSKHQETREKELWLSDPDQCCDINKVQPIQDLKSKYKIWMSGLIGFQNQYRRNLNIVTEKTEMLRCYPLIDWNKGMVDEYMEVYGLPRNPLEEQGYSSIGCTHCTMPGRGREGRWSEDMKTECGLHR